MAHQGQKGCHWCEGHWPKSRAFRRNIFDGHHLWLGQDNPLRPAGDTETAPPERTPASIDRDARESRDSDLPHKSQRHPRRSTGVNGVSALSLLPLFNIVWDVLPDWMHIVKNVMLGHFVKVVKGKRRLIPPMYFKTPGPEASRARQRAVKRSVIWCHIRCNIRCDFLSHRNAGKTRK